MRWFKLILKITGIILGIVIIGIIIFLNTPYMKNIVERLANRFLKGEVSIESLRLTPVSIRIRGFNWSENGEDIVKLDYCGVNFNPLEIKNLKIRKVVVIGLDLNAPESLKAHLNLPEKKRKKIPPITVKSIRLDSIRVYSKGHKIDLNTTLSIISDTSGMNIGFSRLVFNLDEEELVSGMNGEILIKDINSIRIDSVSMGLIGGRMFVDGIIDTTLNLSLLMTNIHLSKFQGIARDTTLTGILNLKAMVGGKIKEPDVKARINLRKPVFKGYSLNLVNIDAKLNGKKYIANLTVDSELSGVVEGEIQGFTGGKLKLTKLNLEKFTGTGTELNGNITFNLDKNFNGNFNIQLYHSNYEGINIDKINLIAKRVGSDYYLDTLVVVGEMGRLFAGGEFVSGALDVSAWSDSLHIGVVKKFVKRFDMDGILRMNLVVKGKPQNPAATGNISIHKFTFRNMSMDSISLALNLSDKKNGSTEIRIRNFRRGKITVDTLHLKASLEDTIARFGIITYLGKQNLKISGKTTTGMPLVCRLDTLRIRKKGKKDIKNLKPILINMNRGKLSIQDFSMKGPGLQVILNGTLGKRLDFIMNLSSPDLRRIAMYMGLKHILKGDVDLYINVQGTRTSPIASVYGKINQFQFDEANFDSISIIAEYNKNRVKLIGLNLVKDTIVSHVDAEIPMGKKGIDKNGDFSFNANIKFDNIAWALTRWRSMIDVYKGGIYMKVNGSGSINNPVFDGNVNIQNLCMNIPTVNLKMEGFDGDVAISKKGIDIDIKNRDKTIKVNGKMGMEGFRMDKIDIGIDLTGLHIKDVMNVEALLDGKLKYAGTVKHASLTGDINIYKVVANIPFQGRRKGTKPKPSPVDIDIKIHMPRNVWVRNEFVDMELGGDIRFIRKQRMKMEGTMEIKGGYFYYFDKPFDVEEGKFVFVEDIIPNMNLKARSTLTYRYTDEDGETREIQGPVILIVSGTLDNLQFDLYTEPPLPPLTLQEIIPLLNLDMTWSELASFQRMSKTLPSKAVSFFLRTQLLNRIQSSLGIDALDLNANLFGEEKSTQITVGKYFTKNLYGSYTHDILSEYPDQFLLKYILKHGDIIIQRDEYGRYWGGFEITISR